MISEYWLTAAGIAAAAIYAAIAVIRKVQYDRILLYVIFILYMTTLIGATMFPVIIDNSMTAASSDPSDRIKLIPFMTIAEELTETSAFNAFVQIAGNIVMTVPFGLLFALLYPIKHKYICIIAAAALPLWIELTQLILDIITGTWYRTFDVDDIILNFSGIMLGFLIYRLLPEKIRRKFKGSTE